MGVEPTKSFPTTGFEPAAFSNFAREAEWFRKGIEAAHFVRYTSFHLFELKRRERPQGLSYRTERAPSGIRTHNFSLTRRTHQPLVPPGQERACWRRERGSKPQGFYARRVSNPVPSPSFGLSLQRVQSFNRRIVVSATRAIAAPTVYAAMSDHVNVLPRMTSVRRFGSMPRRFTRSSAWPISTM